MAAARRPARSERAPEPLASARAFAAPKRSPRTVAQVQALISLVEAASQLERDAVDLLKTADLTPAQFNVLRILRGAGPEGATCGQVGERLIRHDPDVTRLLDRLDRRRLIARGRDAADRRIVRTRITGKGLALIAELDAPLDAMHERQLGHLSERQLSDLRELVETLRTRQPG